MAVQFDPRYSAQAQTDARLYADAVLRKRGAADRVGEDINNLAQTMFALDERHKQEMTEKFKSLSTVGAMFGWDKLPQSALESYAGAIDGMSGSKVYPRDSTGKALAPSPSIEDMTRSYLQHMSPEEQTKKIRRDLGLDPSAKDQAAAQWRTQKMEHDDAYKMMKLEHDDSYHATMAGLRAMEVKARTDAAQARGKGGKADRASGMVLDNGVFREAKPGEASLNQQMYENLRTQKKLDSSAKVAKAKLQLSVQQANWKMENSPELTDKMAKEVRGTAVSMMKSKDPEQARLGKLMFIDSYRKVSESGGIDLTPEQISAELNKPGGLDKLLSMGRSIAGAISGGEAGGPKLTPEADKVFNDIMNQGAQP